MDRQRGQVGKRVVRALVGLATTVMAAALLAPAAAASPIGDAEAAIMAAWDKAGGDTSTLGARKGDVYPVGDGFACDFDNGRFYYSTATGAKSMYGPILAKYDQLGGPAGSDLGFPTISEVPGLAGPDSRVTTFAASDSPVIFWTPDHGAFVVRGAMNAAWDKLGSSGGVLGAPVRDESYDGDVSSQKFTGGEISWNRKTKEFSTNPPALGEQLLGLQVAPDPTAAISQAWRAAGGASGPLGARKGDQQPIGGDGIVQEFAGGKIFFSPATGAGALESDILAKYESVGGPVGSELGFPVANESEGGIGASSRIATFSASDKPAIFWTSDHGAFVVRGAIKAAWDKLKGASGKLGAPVGDQATDGDVISQKFTGGKISWNRATNTFSTDPANLAPLLSGLQVAGQNQPSTAASPPHDHKFTWHWWWLVGAVPVLLLIVMFVLVVIAWRRRHSRPDTAAYQHDHDAEPGYDAPGDGYWPPEDEEFRAEQFAHAEPHPPEDLEDAGAAGRVSWSRGAEAEPVQGADEYGSEYGDVPPRADEGFVFEEQEDPDAVDTTPTAVVTEADLSAEVLEDPVVPEVVGPEEVDAPQVVGTDADFPDAAPLDAPVSEDDVADAEIEASEPRSGRHAAVDPDAPEFEAEEIHAAAAFDETAPAAASAPAAGLLRPRPAARPTFRLPLDDPYQPPEGYPIKANASFGLYYTPSSALYHDTIAEFWFASEEVAKANGFVKAD